MSSHSQQPVRIVLIGASNLTFSFPLVINSIMQSVDSPIEIFAAHGHGRSFCQWSYVLHRGLPSVLDCGLWNAVTAQPAPSQSWGLVTDVGNDLIYGNAVDPLLERLHETFHRLQSLVAGMTYVRLPVERVQMLTAGKYRIIKKLLFPGPTVPWETMLQRVVEFDARATALAEEFGAKILTPRLEWYGIDPIHIRRSRRTAAWKEVLKTWSLPYEPIVSWPPMPLAMQIWNAAAAERRLWKRPRTASQPAIRTPEKVSLWLF